MTEDQARIAAIIEAVPCPKCQAMAKQPCMSTCGRNRDRMRPWLASVHFIRRDLARRWRRQNPSRWNTFMRMAREMDKAAHIEYLKNGGGLLTT